MKKKRKVRFYDNAKRRHSHVHFGYGFNDAYYEFCRINYANKSAPKIHRPERKKFVIEMQSEFSKGFFRRIKERFIAKRASRARNKRARVARRVMRAHA